MSATPPVVIYFGCSDKGQHGRIDLGNLGLIERHFGKDGFVVDLAPGGEVRANEYEGEHGWLANRRRDECVWVEAIEIAEPIVTPERLIDRRLRAHIRCPRCKRHVQWREAVAVNWLRRLHAAGMSEVDISALPSS